MTNTDTYRLLILVESQDENERLISMFRNAGHATRAHRITSRQDLLDHLDDQEWDLLIADDKHPDLSLTDACELIGQNSHDIPCLLLIDNADASTIVAGFEKGAQDIINKENDQHMLLAAKREISNVRARIQRFNLEKELQEVTQRAEQLLGDSQEAIAFVADGMHIEANDAYAEIFGYESSDDLECLPIIDLVAEKDQERFKAFLRHYSKGETDQAELGFIGQRNDNGEFNAHMTLSSSSIEGEPCTQVLIRSQNDAAAIGGAGSLSTMDPISGLYNRHYLADQLSTSAVQVGDGLLATLLYIEIDNFNHFLHEFGIYGGDILIKDLASLLQDKIGEHDCLTRFGDSSLTLLLHDRSPEQAREFAEECCKIVEDHICEAMQQTLQYTISIGIAPLSSRNANEVVDNSYRAIIQMRERNESNCSAIYVPHIARTSQQEHSATASLDEAIDQDRFRLLFQPIISLRGDSREHYEVFLRMLDENNKEIPPAEFLASAADTRLDRWVILESTKILSMHRAKGHDTRLIVNLTSNALLDGSLAPWIGVALKAANLPPDCIIFQFSELSIGKHLKSAKVATQVLSDMGCKVSLGQFGRSVDPVKTLKHVTVDFVKIDGSFTLDLQENQGDPQVLKALINTITENGMLSIVPCVENAGVLATLWQVGVNYIQGHYLQPPSPKMDYEFTELA
jgi:diguanylate cyclase (GGDEF)-like protein/PAS domain S-box-containing protein